MMNISLFAEPPVINRVSQIRKDILDNLVRNTTWYNVVNSSITKLQSDMDMLNITKVPYIGATNDVNLGVHSITASHFYGDGSGLYGISGDNLGNHIATTTLNMNNNNIDNIGAMTANGNIYLQSYSSNQYFKLQNNNILELKMNNSNIAIPSYGGIILNDPSMIDFNVNNNDTRLTINSSSYNNGGFDIKGKLADVRVPYINFNDIMEISTGSIDGLGAVVEVGGNSAVLFNGNATVFNNEVDIGSDNQLLVKKCSGATFMYDIHIDSTAPLGFTPIYHTLPDYLFVGNESHCIDSGGTVSATHTLKIKFD
ncbi:MAG: hypothetical protein GYA62_04200 [Bacteroidales bacterium]|nr:hypothetical protein [Bacteroidales bacterium]